MRLELILLGISMGVAFAAPPGVITAETIRRGARGGFAHGLAVQLGSLLGDATYALLALAGLAALLQSRPAQILVGALGAVVMVYLARQAWRAPALAAANLGAGPGESIGQSLASGAVLSLTNPWAVAFWLALGGTFASLGVDDASLLAGVFLSFMTGAVAWSLALAAAVGWGRRFLTPRLFRAVSIGCSAALALFAVAAAVKVVGVLIGS